MRADQFRRSGAGLGRTSVEDMITSLAISQIFVLDQDQALDFYVGKLGLEVSNDVDLGFMRWLTVRVPGEDREILLERPGPPGYDPATADAVREMVTKGASGGTLFFNTDDAQAAHAELKDKGVELPEEPTTQSYGIDFGFRDPFGNNIRIAQRSDPQEQ
jgi:catechol 2,3-dioxygenase-like lactoylglutathione lyase family enzyme